jgi:hypothetical protein
VHNGLVTIWKVNLALDDPEVEAIREAAIDLLSPERHGVVTEVFRDGSDGQSVLVLDVDAGSLGGAVNQATGTWTRLRSQAGLVPRPPSIGFVVGPIDEPATYHDELLAKARRLAMAGHFEYAVVAAQTAFEIYTRDLIRDLGLSVMPPAVAELVKPRSAGLRDKQSRALFGALIGRPISDSGQLWNQYNEHVLRRNGVVHEGATVDQAGADESIAVVRRLVRWIEKAAEKRA